jgi:stress response protein SCP2
VIDAVYYNELVSLDKSVFHSGDSRSGEGSGDDETIKINLGTISSQTKALCVVVDNLHFKTYYR